MACNLFLYANNTIVDLNTCKCLVAQVCRVASLGGPYFQDCKLPSFSGLAIH